MGLHSAFGCLMANGWTWRISLPTPWVSSSKLQADLPASRRTQLQTRRCRRGSDWGFGGGDARHGPKAGSARPQANSMTRPKQPDRARQPQPSSPTCVHAMRRYVATLSGPCDVLASLPVTSSNGAPDPRVSSESWHSMVSQSQFSPNDCGHARRGGCLAHPDLNPN